MGFLRPCESRTADREVSPPAGRREDTRRGAGSCCRASTSRTARCRRRTRSESRAEAAPREATPLACRGARARGASRRRSRTPRVRTASSPPAPRRRPREDGPPHLRLTVKLTGTATTPHNPYKCGSSQIYIFAHEQPSTFTGHRNLPIFHY